MKFGAGPHGWGWGPGCCAAPDRAGMPGLPQQALETAWMSRPSQAPRRPARHLPAPLNLPLRSQGTWGPGPLLRATLTRPCSQQRPGCRGGRGPVYQVPLLLPSLCLFLCLVSVFLVFSLPPARPGPFRGFCSIWICSRPRFHSWFPLSQGLGSPDGHL